MAFENAEVKILDTERVLDTDPELYKRRALDALERHFFQDALIEAEKAIQYGNNWPRYQAVKARVLLATEKYDECIAYILKGSDLWKKKDDAIELSNEDKDFIRYAFSVCYGQLGHPPDILPEIILTADGRGMCKSIQEAVDKYSDKKILLTGGWYNEDVIIDGKTVRIIGSYYSKPKVNGRWKIKNSFCTIKTLLFHNQSDRAGIMLEIENSRFKIEDLSFNSLINPYSIKPDSESMTNVGDLVGVCIENSVAKENVNEMKFNNLSMGIACEDSYVYVTNSDFSNCTGGVLCHNKKGKHVVTLSHCTFRQNYVGCFITKNGEMTIQYSGFENNDFAILLNKDGIDGEEYTSNEGNEKVLMKACRIIGSKRIAIGNDGGICIVKDSLLKNNAQEYSDTGGGTYEKERTTETGNTSAGPLKEGVKSIFKSLFS